MISKTHAKDWHPADIKAALAKQGWTFARIARRFGFCPTLPNKVLYRRWHRMEQEVARLIGVPARVIWPSRYFPDGRTRYGRRPGGERSVTLQS